MTSTTPHSTLRDDLEDAVHALIGHRLHSHTDTDGRTRSGYRESVYAEIRTELAARVGDGGTLRPRSLPPAWVEGLDWITTVDTTVAAWCPDPGPDDGQPETVRRLNIMAAFAWAPADHELIAECVDELEHWVMAGKALLEPVRRWELVAPCPSCAARTVHRDDPSGELVRQAALQISTEGCVCLSCHTSWAPALYRLLAAVLGCEIPTGIVE